MYLMPLKWTLRNRMLNCKLCVLHTLSKVVLCSKITYIWCWYAHLLELSSPQRLKEKKKIFLMFINNEKHQMYNSKNLCRLEVLCFFIVFLQIKSKITAKKILCEINRWLDNVEENTGELENSKRNHWKKNKLKREWTEHRWPMPCL